MTIALSIGGACLLMATLMIAVVFLGAFQLGRLVTRDDEQRAVFEPDCIIAVANELLDRK